MTTLQDAKLLTLRTELGAEGHVNDLEAAWLISLGATAVDILGMWGQVFTAAAIPAGHHNDRALLYITATVGAPPTPDYNAAWQHYWENATLGPAPCGPPIDPTTILNLFAYYDARVSSSVWADIARTIQATNGSDLRTWDDLSGGGRHYQQGVAARPTFATAHTTLGPAGVFAGGQFLVNNIGNFPMAQGMTVIMYADSTAAGGWSSIAALFEYYASSNDGMRINSQSNRMASAWEIPPQMLMTSGRQELGPGVAPFTVGARYLVTNVTAGGPGFPITGDWQNNLWVDGVDEGSGPVRLGANETANLILSRIGDHTVFNGWVGGIQRVYIYDRYLTTLELCGAQEFIKANP